MAVHPLQIEYAALDAACLLGLLEAYICLCLTKPVCPGASVFFGPSNTEMAELYEENNMIVKWSTTTSMPCKQF